MTIFASSRGRARTRTGRRGFRLCAAAWLALAALATAAGSARASSPDQLEDTEAKSEYAYFTEDRHALDHLVGDIKSFAESADPLELYAFAHAEFRRLQLAASAHAPRDAENAGNACLAALDRRGAALVHDPEALALAAACAGYLAEFGGLKHLTAGHRRDASLEAARGLAPANPRVLLVGGILGWFAAPGSPAGRAQARAALARATGFFDAVTATAPGAPTWGGAEAWLFVGRGLEEDGNLVGARNAYERSLLVAPDFAAAKRRLARLAARR